MSASAWSADECALLRRLAAEGLTASAITMALNRALGGRRSRNAVLGKLLRMRIAMQSKHVASDPGRRSKPVSASSPRAGKAGAATPPRAAPATSSAVPAAPEAPVAKLPATLPVRFIDAMFADCCLHFVGDPLGLDGPDMPVCGAERAQDASPHNRYCRRHLASQREAVAA